MFYFESSSDIIAWTINFCTPHNLYQSSSYLKMSRLLKFCHPVIQTYFWCKVMHINAWSLQQSCHGAMVDTPPPPPHFITSQVIIEYNQGFFFKIRRIRLHSIYIVDLFIKTILSCTITLSFCLVVGWVAGGVSCYFGR